MKSITCNDIQNCINSGIDITNIIEKIYDIIKLEYPEHQNWFSEKVIPDIYKNKRNIILLYNKNKIIGFANLKKTDKEKKISTIYIDSSYDSSKNWNIIIEQAIKWLNENKPTLIITKKQTANHISDISKRGWHITDSTYNSDIVINRYNEIENAITKYIKKRKSI